MPSTADTMQIDIHSAALSLEYAHHMRILKAMTGQESCFTTAKRG
jgi:hypothetical protein